MGALSTGITIFDSDETLETVGRKADLDAFYKLIEEGARNRPAAPAASMRDMIFVFTSNALSDALTDADTARDMGHELGHALPESLLKRVGDVVMFKPLSDDTVKKIATRTAGKELLGMGYDAEDSAAIAAAVAEKMMEGYASDNGARQLKGKFKAIAGAPGFKNDYFPLTKAGKAEAKRKIRAAVVQAFREGPGDVSAPPRAIFKKKTYQRNI